LVDWIQEVKRVRIILKVLALTSRWLVVSFPERQNTKDRFGVKLEIPIRQTSKILTRTGLRGLTPVILATQEAEIMRIAVRSQPGQTVREPFTKRSGGVAQGEDPELKPQYHKKKKKKKKILTR
jgi:hypothetical protein